MILNTVMKIKQLFHRRKMAYVICFSKDTPNGRVVLEDLAKFCRAHDSTYVNDPRMSAVLDGRREVWLRIQMYLNLNIDELYDLHHVKTKGE